MWLPNANKSLPILEHALYCLDVILAKKIVCGVKLYPNQPTMTLTEQKTDHPSLPFPEGKGSTPSDCKAVTFPSRGRILSKTTVESE